MESPRTITFFPFQDDAQPHTPSGEVQPHVTDRTTAPNAALTMFFFMFSTLHFQSVSRVHAFRIPMSETVGSPDDPAGQKK